MSAGSAWPLVNRLRTFGRVSGLAFGSTGKASKDAKELVAAIGDALAALHAQRFGRTDASTAASEAWGFARRGLAMTALRTRALMLLDRVSHHISVGSLHLADQNHRICGAQNFSATFDFVTGACASRPLFSQ